MGSVDIFLQCLHTHANTRASEMEPSARLRGDGPAVGNTVLGAARLWPLYVLFI